MDNTNQFPNLESCSPSSCISGQIMKCNRIVANVFRKYLSPFNITDSQLSMLFVISKINEVTQKRISEILYLEKSTVNRNLKRLKENHYITFDQKVFISITNEGKVFLEQLIPEWDLAMKEIREIIGEEGESALNLLTKQLTH